MARPEPDQDDGAKRRLTSEVCLLFVLFDLGNLNYCSRGIKKKNSKGFKPMDVCTCTYESNGKSHTRAHGGFFFLFFSQIIFSKRKNSIYQSVILSALKRKAITYLRGGGAMGKGWVDLVVALLLFVIWETCTHTTSLSPS